MVLVTYCAHTDCRCHPQCEIFLDKRSDLHGWNFTCLPGSGVQNVWVNGVQNYCVTVQPVKFHINPFFIFKKNDTPTHE